jgi:hypothetical protein
MPRRRQRIITGDAQRRGNWTKVFWLEEERVVSEDWVVRYQNRLLQLERPSRPRVPAKSRVLVRENQAGEVAIHYRVCRRKAVCVKLPASDLNLVVQGLMNR